MFKLLKEILFLSWFLFLYCFIFYILKMTLNYDIDQNKIIGNSIKNVSFIQNPGVYEILDPINNKSYYGETSCIIKRLNIYIRTLKVGNHFCKDLQTAFNQQKNPNNFKYFIIAEGPEWEEKNKRVELQNQLISENKHRTYNTIQAKPSKIRKIEYHGMEYPNIREAVRKIKISRASLYRMLKNPNNKDVIYLENENEGISHGSIAIFAKKDSSPSLFFPSIKACIRAKFAKSVYEVHEKIKNKQTGWKYATVDPNGCPLRVIYVLKPGEISYENYLFQNNQTEI